MENYSDYRVFPIGRNLSVSVSLPKGAGKKAYAIERAKTIIRESNHAILKISYDIMA